MKSTNVLGHLVGATAVYLAVATTVSFTGGVSAPMKSASAASDGPDRFGTAAPQTLEWVDTCSLTREVRGVPHHFARHDFAMRRSVVALGRANVLGHFALPSANRPKDFTHAQVSQGVFVKDGSIAVDCGADSDPNRFDSVVLILPRTYKVELDRSNPYNDEI